MYGSLCSLIQLKDAYLVVEIAADIEVHISGTAGIVKVCKTVLKLVVHVFITQHEVDRCT